MNENEYDNLEEIRSLSQERFIKYFEKYFVGRDIFQSIYERLRESVIDLSKVFIQFDFLLDSIKILKDDRKLYKKLSKEQKELLDNYEISVEHITQELFAILKDISEGLKP